MNLFIDVTNSCRSPRTTGMQRTTRRIFSELAARLPVTPVCWNKAGNIYHRLGVREMENLEAPFRSYRGPLSRPHASEGVFGELGRLLGRPRIDIGKELREGDVVFVPEMFSDRRTRKLPVLLKRTQARSIAIFHDAADLRLGLLSARRAAKFRKYLKALAAFDLVICISNQSRDDLVEFWKQAGLTAGETIVADWPIEFDASMRSETENDPRPVILYVSAFTPRKNHLLLLRAAEQLWKKKSQFELQLIGPLTPYGKDVVREIRRLHALGQPVRWLKHVDDQTLHQTYRDCRFTVYPSLMEGFGLPIAESLWHGKPCVCGGNGALGELARGGGCLIVDQTSAGAIAEGIESLLSDRQLYSRLCEEARMRRFYSWPDYIDRLMNCLEPARSASLTSH